MNCPRCKNDTLTFGQHCLECGYIVEQNHHEHFYQFGTDKYAVQCYVSYGLLTGKSRIWLRPSGRFISQLDILIPPDATEDYIDKLLLLQ